MQREIPTDHLIVNVDDHPDVLSARTFFLREAGFQVHEAETGEEALSLVKSLQPQLVLLDVNLPDISGLEVCRRLKADESTKTVMVMQISASLVGAHDRIAGLEEGADSYVDASINPSELIARIHALLRLWRAEQKSRENEERYRTVLDNIREVIFQLDMEGNWTFISPSWTKITGWPVSGCLGRHFLAHAHPDDRLDAVSLFNTLVSGEKHDSRFAVRHRSPVTPGGGSNSIVPQ